MVILGHSQNILERQPIYASLRIYNIFHGARAVTAYVEGLEIHVESVGYFGSDVGMHVPLTSRGHPVRRLDPADLMSNYLKPMRTVGLGIGSMTEDTSILRRDLRTWDRVRVMRVRLRSNQLQEFAVMCTCYMPSLEALLIHVPLSPPLNKMRQIQVQLARFTATIGRYCPQFRYVKFICSHQGWPRDIAYVLKYVQTGWDHQGDQASRQGRLEPLHHCCDVDEEPEAFWAGPRKMLYLADCDTV
ncbi:hypothetical protein VPNG_07281 [Cytospora leucostoma]|uniref:Uncharacterized protein n=1 Tax=Cytospora leucostoma TaxID=1230097 RepID=A0A423WK79_9PEZI|nr:hypothetical protein VPNG_07281 [Cytospora leucostoma]